MSYVVEESWAVDTYVKGYYDARLTGLDVLPDVDSHWSDCFDVRHAEDFHFPDPNTLPPLPDRQLKLGTVKTEYVSFYRVHSKKYFGWGADFPSNWRDDDRKRSAVERFSPPGTVGHYFGLTPDAALDEALYYGNGQIDSQERFFLMIRCYFDNLLYLTQVGVLAAVWKLLNLDRMSLGDMYFKIMDPHTDSEITNKIGIWSREYGFAGLIFPSARYGQQLDIEALRKAGCRPFPALNAVSIGSRLDKRVQPFEAVLSDNVIYEEAGPTDGTPVAIYAEPNLVLFSGDQLQGSDRAIFYVGVPLEHRDYVIATDLRMQKKKIEHWMY
jgi:hypothetical protein